MAKDWGLEWRLVPPKGRESCRWQSIDSAWISLTLGHQGDITKIVISASDGRGEVVDGYEEGLNLARRWRTSWASWRSTSASGSQPSYNSTPPAPAHGVPETPSRQSLSGRHSVVSGPPTGRESRLSRPPSMPPTGSSPPSLEQMDRLSKLIPPEDRAEMFSRFSPSSPPSAHSDPLEDRRGSNPAIPARDARMSPIPGRVPRSPRRPLSPEPSKLLLPGAGIAAPEPGTSPRDSGAHTIILGQDGKEIGPATSGPLGATEPDQPLRPSTAPGSGPPSTTSRSPLRRP